MEVPPLGPQTHIDGLPDELLHAAVVPDVGGDGGRLAACLPDLALDGADGGLGGVGVRGEGERGGVGVAGGFGGDDDCFFL